MTLGSPMSREAFARATDEEVIKAFQELPDATGWDHPRRRMVGGNIQLSREFAEFAKGDIDRAAQLIRKLEPTFGQRAAGYALDAIAENADPLLIVALFCELVDRGFDSEEFRNSAARAVERLVRRDYPVGDDVLGRLESWLSVEPPSDFVEDEKNAGVQSLTEEPGSSEDDDAEGGSVLWDYIGFSIVPHGNYPVLEAITRILIARPDHDRLGGILSAHLQRAELPDVWQALLYHLIQFHPTDEAVRPGIIKEIFRRYPAVLRSREAVQILAHAQWWAPSMVQEVLSEWPTDTARMRQAYAELVALIAVMQPSLSWAADALGNMLSNSVDRDFRLGAAYSAARLWQEAKHRHATTKLLEQLAERADQRTLEAIFGVFRLVDELTPDLDTINLLKVIADNVESAGGADATFVVERLQTLLPYQAPLVGRLTQGLVGQWRQELGDIRTAKSAVASDLVDLAITLHRLGPETRDVGTRILEDLLVIDAWEARNTLDEIDSRFRPGRSPTRKRLRRRSGRSRRR